MDDLKNTLLNKLQEGSLLVKFNVDGSLSEGFFYICPKLKSICYNVSKKRLQNVTYECNVNKISFCLIVFFSLIDLLKDCEVRAGLKTDAWIKVLRIGKVREQQVIRLLNPLI
jgi:hypothetical protein